MLRECMCIIDVASLPTKDGIIAVKSSFTGICWKQSFLTRLHNLLELFILLQSMDIIFFKFIFLNESQADPQCDLKEYINKEYFAGVWLSLVGYTQGNDRAEKVIQVSMRFGQHFRHAINILLNVKQGRVEMKQFILEQGVDPKNIEDLIFQDATQTAKNQHTSYKHGFTATKFTAQPENHFMAFVQLARLLETLGLSPFRYFPLRRSWSPGNIDKLDYWKQVVDLNAKPFKAQEENKLLRICEKIRQADEKFEYISDLSAQEHKAMNGRVLLLIPEEETFCFVPMKNLLWKSLLSFDILSRTRQSKTYRNILQAMKLNNPAVYQAENILA
ncbi:uncharacterized protein EV154DRAFT_487790 [Mucor mucedo]|uniref:uncharacterized protein n=1 Tax=Mucor mucedo TaxID=29922 RepID=UPI00221F9965|nr:uncharacterized protein EV154DRAFT_487790 [Mucor mucedo]KAI7870485.1 hypothetical protein EV154DRAFT_487790 [Mucor mucedo]